MSYSRRIASLEESYRLVEIQINAESKSENRDTEKINRLIEAREKYLAQLREMRRAQYEASQEVDFGDDR